MPVGRLEAFSDGVSAIVSTLLILDLKKPESPDRLIGPRLLQPDHFDDRPGLAGAGGDQQRSDRGDDVPQHQPAEAVALVTYAVPDLCPGVMSPRGGNNPPMIANP